MKQVVGIAAILCIGALGTKVCAAASPAYTFVPFPDFGYGSFATCINKEGQAVGTAFLANGDYHATLWNPGQSVVDLGTTAGYSSSFAACINDSGQIVGSEYSPDDGARGGFLWQGSTGMVEIASGNLTTEVTRINAAGQFVGAASPDNFTQSEFGILSTSPTQISPLSVPGLTVDNVLAINDNGQMILDRGGSSNPIFYTPGQPPVEITAPNITSATALAMNNQGVVVGTASLPIPANNHAFVWTQTGGMIDLTPGANAFGYANAVNAEGDVVGIEGVASQSQNAFIWQGGAMYDLDTLVQGMPAGWSDLWPQSINDEGEIVGVAQYNGVAQAFLLVPTTSDVPEPASLAMLALGATALLRRRRR